jgi:hypothetical protein
MAIPLQKKRSQWLFDEILTEHIGRFSVNWPEFCKPRPAGEQAGAGFCHGDRH